MIRFGLIGCGSIHKTHLDAIAAIDGAEVSAVYDVLHERTQLAAEAAQAHAAKSIPDLLKRVDAVSVCTPSGLHAKIGMAAAKAGKHVIVEKPIDVGIKPAMKLVEACRGAGVKLSVISQHRFARDVQRLRHLVQAGDLGKPVSAEACIKWYRTQAYYNSADWRGTLALDGGGCLINQSIHYLDQLQWVMGGVASVQAISRTAAHTMEGEDAINLLLEFRNGAIGVVQSTTCAFPGFRERVEVVGEYGTAILEGDRIRFLESDPAAPKSSSPYGRDLKYHPLPTHSVFDAVPAEAEDDPTVSWSMQHRMQLQDFVDAIREDRDPFITGEAALEPLRIVLAAYRSARNGGRRVEIDAIR